MCKLQFSIFKIKFQYWIIGRLCQPSYNLLVNSVRHTYPIGSWEKIIGDREIVGHGINGDPTYFDCVMTPCPAIRFQSNSPYIQVTARFYQLRHCKCFLY